MNAGAAQPQPNAPLRVALVGSPNAGKTTLFNWLTGSSARIGNYPGVTVERREGVLRREGKCVDTGLSLRPQQAENVPCTAQ